MGDCRIESRTRQEGGWLVLCALTWPDRYTSGPHWVEGPETMTDAQIAAAVLAQYETGA